MHEILKNKKVVFFDVGYTISLPASGDWIFTNKFNEVAGERLGRYSEGEIRRALSKASDYLAENHLLFTEGEEVGCYCHYYRIFSDELDMGLTDGEIMKIVKDRTFNMANYLMYPGVKETLEELSKTHLLGVISDTWPSIDRMLRSFGILKYFSFTTYSCSLGVFKPDPRMYQDALNKSGCEAADCVFIDDSPKNLAGAADMGITPILIAANPASDVDTPYLKIRSLTELI